MKIIFATQNQHKLRELQEMLGSTFNLLSLNDLNYTDDIPETKETIAENASQKAWFVYNLFGENCFADDTGLEVEALNGEPGVYSARYAGENKDSQANIAKLLEKLNNHTNRNARFVTVISLIINQKEFLFEGIVEGDILYEKHGTAGFGYDSVFQPKGFTQTFAQMQAETKNKISHRGLAVKKLVDFLIQNK